MRGITKMTLANRVNDMDRRHDDARGNYGPENRRDSRGRYAPRNEMNPYDRMPERYAPAGNYENNYRMGHDGGWVVKPIEDRMGEEGIPESRRDRFGRYAPRNEGPESWMPPYWENRMDGGRYRMNDDGDRMIGFAGAEVMDGYRMDTAHVPKDELSNYRSQKHAGHASSKDTPFDRKTAQEWVQKMKNADGSTGEHWTFEQTSQVMKQRGIDCDPAEFYATMNMLWSDYGSVAKKYGTDNVEFWAEMAKSFLLDKDAEGNKLALYYENIAKK